MAIHSSILAWRIPEIEEPGGLQSTGSQRVGQYSALSISIVYLIWALWALNEITIQKVLNIILNGLPGGSDTKESPWNAGDLGSILGLGRSPGGWHGNLLQYSCLENPHGQRSLVGYSPRGHKESDMTEWPTQHNNLSMPRKAFLFVYAKFHRLSTFLLFH